MNDFVRKHAHMDDIETSFDAAESIEGTAAAHKALVFKTLKKIGPLSSEQIAKVTGLTPLQVMKRVSDLRDGGMVLDSGERRPTVSGRNAAVWRLKTRADDEITKRIQAKD